MTTAAEIQQVRDAIKAEDYDSASAQLGAREAWPDLFLHFAHELVVNGPEPVYLENLTISESWNLQSESASSFGLARTHLYAVPTADEAVLQLPASGSTFEPARGYVWHIRNGSASNRLTVDPDGAAVVDGASTLDVEPGGSVLLSYDAISGAEYSVVCSSSSPRTVRVPLVASDAAAGLLDWENPFGAALVVSLVLDVTTPTSGACEADFGVAASAVADDDLVDQLDLSAAGVYSSADDAGPNGRTYRRMASGDHLTGSVFSGASAGLVGNAFVEYRFA